MISRISVENSTSKLNSNYSRKDREAHQEPNFKGMGGLVLSGIQACERMPMVNVAVIDMLSAILPRTIVESWTNWFAGFEAFRRESSGLVVNCIIPAFIAYGIATCVNPLIMPKGSNMSGCWADSILIDKAANYYNNASSSDKVEESMKALISDIQGFEGKNTVKFSEALTKEELKGYSEKLAELSRKDISTHKMCKEIKAISNDIIKKTHVAENIKIVDGKNEVKASSVNSMLEDSVKFYKEYQKTASKVSIDEFAKHSKKLVRTKSIAGLAIVLPLAASMQYINRWITGKISGTKGAPIYEDFAKGKDNIEENPKAKEGLLTQKLISISSMIGVSLLSMMKMPSMNMLEFKGIFPTMDQARIISTCTFASRMAAADDKNELAEATVRDIATFSSLYFLGDYAAKGAATLIQKHTGVSLLNETKPLKENANALQKAWHWIKDVNIKSSEEVISKTEQSLKGAKPTEAQLKTIEKEIKHAVNLRSACQVANLGVSLALLGLVIPIFTRRNTKKKHEQALKLAQEAQSQENTTEKQNKAVITPLNVKYSDLTTGFRSDKKYKIA